MAAYRPCHRPAESVMSSLSDSRWVGVLEGALNPHVSTAGTAGYGWVRDDLQAFPPVRGTVLPPYWSCDGTDAFSGEMHHFSSAPVFFNAALSPRLMCQ